MRHTTIARAYPDSRGTEHGGPSWRADACGHVGAHLTRIEQAERIDQVLEAELVGVDPLVAAAVLQRHHLRGCDRETGGLVARDDLVEPLLRGVAQDRQRARGDPSAEADEL